MPPHGSFRFATQLLRRWRASNSGGVLIYIAFGLPILLGSMALSIDLGRTFILNTELKDFSDAAALAGAAELDGRDGARDAAYNAATTGISGNLINIQAFATDGSGLNMQVDVNNVVFLRQLPADGTNFKSSDVATSDADARFIFVSVVNRSVRSGLSRALGVIPDFATSARSIAGFNAVTCKIPALFMCNPLEDNDYPVRGTECDDYLALHSFGTGARLRGVETEASKCIRGKGVLAKTGGGSGGSYFPGEFGLLDCSLFAQANPDFKGNSGADCVAESIAQYSPSNCISGKAFVQTGQATRPVADAINVRFDYYGPFFGGNNSGKPDAPRNNEKYAPAKNVTKGFEPDTGKGCSKEGTNPTETIALPRDDCFYNGNTCGPGASAGRWGDGNWHANGRDLSYWQVNHQNIAADPSNFDYSRDAQLPTGFSTMTRYDVYRKEVDTDSPVAPDPGIPMPSPSNNSLVEKGKSCNYKAGVFYDPSDNPDYNYPDTVDYVKDRRIVRAAIVNCKAEGKLTGASSNHPNGVNIEGVIDIFLTEPAFIPGGPDAGSKDDTNFDIWGEFVHVESADETGLKDIVQLYR